MLPAPSVVEGVPGFDAASVRPETAGAYGVLPVPEVPGSMGRNRLTSRLWIQTAAWPLPHRRGHEDCPKEFLTASGFRLKAQFQ